MAPGDAGQPVQVVAGDIELGGGRLQGGQLAQLLLDHPAGVRWHRIFERLHLVPKAAAKPFGVVSQIPAAAILSRKLQQNRLEWYHRYQQLPGVWWKRSQIPLLRQLPSQCTHTYGRTRESSPDSNEERGTHGIFQWQAIQSRITILHFLSSIQLSGRGVI